MADLLQQLDNLEQSIREQVETYKLVQAPGSTGREECASCPLFLQQLTSAVQVLDKIVPLTQKLQETLDELVVRGMTLVTQTRRRAISGNSVRALIAKIEASRSKLQEERRVRDKLSGRHNYQRFSELAARMKSSPCSTPQGRKHVG